MGVSIRTICVIASFLAAALSPSKVRADCECGYSINATSSQFTELLETDFLHLEDLTLNNAWLPQNYSVTASAARGPYGKTASLENVVANPLPNKHDWTGHGVSGGEPGLQLWVRGGIPKDRLIPMAEIATSREDMLYGSFRTSILVSDIPGTCAAFFWYFNDTEEIDFEFLSTQFNASSWPVNLVLQSPASQKAGYDAAGTPSFDVHHLPFQPDGGYHEYRFDWSPDKVSFYADGIWLKDMTESVPTSPGHITLNHWSNGNLDWSGGPPVVDAVMTVSYVKAYFNSSTPSRQQEYRRRCTNATATNATCVIPDQVVASDLSGGARNSTQNTFFFSQQHNMTVDQPDQSELGASRASIKSTGAALSIVAAVLMGHALLRCLESLWTL